LSEKDVPEQYQDYAYVFSEEKAKRFPPSREEDHQIKFTDNVPKYFKGGVYSLIVKQTTFLRKWLDEELSKGFIKPLKSPYPCPTFLIEKKNRDYQVVQDYKTLNDFTVPDKHPLSLIANDTILTPFSLSPTTDSAIDSLPELFLAYCTLTDSDDIMSDDDRVVPRGLDSDPVPLLTSCALGLSPFFLSCYRR
jgi:hypothetical protein